MVGMCQNLMVMSLKKSGNLPVEYGMVSCGSDVFVILSICGLIDDFVGKLSEPVFLDISSHFQHTAENNHINHIT